MSLFENHIVPSDAVINCCNKHSVLIQCDNIFVYHMCEQTPDPECMFSFHAGAIQGLDVSRKSHLMATTTVDRQWHTFPHLHTHTFLQTHWLRHYHSICPFLSRFSQSLWLPGKNRTDHKPLQSGWNCTLLGSTFSKCVYMKITWIMLLHTMWCVLTLH